VLQILRPRALIEMISPTVKVLTSAPVGASAVVPPLTVQADVQLLQGPLQRLDVVFKAGANHVLRGRVYLSSDYVPADTPSALFWYPNVETMTAADISNGGNTELTSAFLDSAPFHPFHLSSSNQPSQPILLGDHAPDSVFSIPLFLRSEQQRVCRIRLCMEFIPQKGLESAVMKDFDIVVSFERPLQMNFGLSSMKEAQCGVLREGVPSTVLRGDVISVTTSLTCLGLRSGAIRVLNMSFSHSNDDEEEQVGDQTQILQSKKLFVLEGNKNSVDLLQRTLDAKKKVLLSATERQDNNNGTSSSGNGSGVRLRRDEVFVACVDVTCAEGIDSDPSMDWSLADGGEFDSVEALGGGSTGSTSNTGAAAASSVASIGDVYVEWRTDDDSILLAPDLQSLAPTSTSSASSGSGSFSSFSTSAKDFGGSRTSSKQQQQQLMFSQTSKYLSLEWLPKLGPRASASTKSADSTSTDKASSAALDLRVSSTRICGMMFSVPPVKVVDAPFDVDVIIPSVCKYDKQALVQVVIKSKIWTPERVALSTIVPSRYSTSGGGGAVSFDVTGGGGSNAQIREQAFDHSQHGFMISGCCNAVFDVSVINKQ
jgi:hypothetical protein